MTIVWCLLINHKNAPIGAPFRVDVDVGTVSIAGLKDEVKNVKKVELEDVNADSLIVYQLTGPFKDESQSLRGEVRRIFSENKAKEIRPRSMAAEHHLTDECMLFVQLPHISDSICCMVYGDEDPKCIFTVTVPHQISLRQLKYAIKEEALNSRRENWRVSWDVLPDLWKVSIPVDEQLVTRISSAISSQEPLLETNELEFGDDDLQLGHIHIIVVGSGLRNDADADTDTVPDLPEFKRFKKAVATKGKSPSDASKSSEYRSIQRDAFQAIFDGLAPAVTHFPTVAPPIHIYHPIFHEFTSLVSTSKPNTEDLINVQTLMRKMSTIYDSEVDYCKAVSPALTALIGQSLTKIGNADDRVSSDGAIASYDAVLLIEEAKLSLGSSGDASSQAGVSMRRYWIDSSRTVMRERCCCPTFLIVVAGAWLCVMGGVFTDKVIVQRLTDLKWTALSSTEEESRVAGIATILVALRTCLAKLGAFYANLPNAGIPTLLPSEPHPRFFPYPRSYAKSDGRQVDFRIIKALEKDEPTCVTFLASIGGEEEEDATKKVVVKFVTRYGKDGHLFLAGKGMAPKLHYHGPLPGAMDATDSSIMQMVVMDYIESKDMVPLDGREKVEEILNALHSAGYVFGDLRRPNILFDKMDRAFLIDFNWCGRYDRKEGEGTADSVEDSGSVDTEYARYPLATSQAAGMWVEGVKAGGLILPEHDWGMLRKLEW